MIDKLAWIETKDKAILSTRSKGRDKFYIPGGKREAGESDAAALVREIKEELSVDLTIESLNYFGKFSAQAHGHAEGVLVQITCYTANFTGQLTAPAEIAEFVWLGFTDVDKVSLVDMLIFTYLKEQGQIE